MARPKSSLTSCTGSGSTPFFQLVRVRWPTPPLPRCPKPFANADLLVIMGPLSSPSGFGLLLLAAPAVVFALHGKDGDEAGRPRTCAAAHGPGSSSCVEPGICTPPRTKFSTVALGPSPSLQWDISGGFCGAFSTQQSALSAGAYISQDLVRKANIDQPGAHHMHGNSDPEACSSDPLGCGWEVMPSNVKYTADHLRLTSDEWDYTQPSPQAAAWKKWAKSHLVKQHPIAFFPMCKGDSHSPYPGSCPNGGHVDHVECMYGIFSEHPLDDPTVYPTDVILHTADQVSSNQAPPDEAIQCNERAPPINIKLATKRVSVYAWHRRTASLTTAP